MCACVHVKDRERDSVFESLCVYPENPTDIITKAHIFTMMYC